MRRSIRTFGVWNVFGIRLFRDPVRHDSSDLVIAFPLFSNPVVCLAQVFPAFAVAHPLLAESLH